MLAPYTAVLRDTGAAAPLAASLLARLPLGMTGLAVLLLVREVTGSYGSAGAVAAAYAFAFALVSPMRARTADRQGPIRVLLLMSVLHPLALVALVVLAEADAGTALLAVPAVLAGSTVPPVSAVMRALWGKVVTGSGLTTAFALEAVVIELCFVAGPLLVAGLAALGGPSVAVLTAAVLTFVGTLGLVTTPALRAVQPVQVESRGPLGPLVSPVVRALLFVVFALGAGFGAIEVAMPAFVEGVGSRPAAGGVLLAVWSAGSLLGGVVYGAMRPEIPHRQQLPWLIGTLTVTAALPLLVAGPAGWGAVAMGIALFVYGLGFAPLSACNSVLLSAAAPAGTVTEAFAWSSSMIFGGAALGNAVGGVLVDGPGVPAALAVTLGTAAAAMLLGLRAVRRLPVAV